MQEIVNDIIFEEKKSIFVLFGNRNVLADVLDYFQRVGAVWLSDEHLVKRMAWPNEDVFYKRAYAKFLTVTDFDRFDLIKPSILKEIVAGETFMVGKFLAREYVFLKRVSSKKLLIFAGEVLPKETVFDTDKALGARMKTIFAP